MRHNVFLGASGSGKTELSINFAIRAQHSGGRNVTFFDMDQTKGLFRSRDFFEEMSRHGIEPVDTYNFQDAPIVPAGVVSKIRDESTVCVFDVGGNSAGAVMIGQYTGMMKPEDTEYYYVINPCRPFSETAEEIEQAMAEILLASGVDPSWVKIISNPNMGRETTVAVILEYHRKLECLLERFERFPSALCAGEDLAEAVAGKLEIPVLPVHLYLRGLY